MADWYPKGMDALAAWFANFQTNIGTLSAKYNITAPQLTSIAADNTFVQFWVPVRHSADAFGKQLTAFFNEITGNDPTKDPPAAITFEITDGPTQPPTGIEFRVREIARQIKGHSAYAVADGELLGIVGGGGEVSEGDVKPDIEVSAASSGYLFSVVVSGRAESDMWQVQVQPAGSSGWTTVASATGKATDVVYSPAGEESGPVQLNVRVQLRRSNANYGEPSDIAQVTVNP